MCAIIDTASCSFTAPTCTTLIMLECWFGQIVQTETREIYVLTWKHDWEISPSKYGRLLITEANDLAFILLVPGCKVFYINNIKV